SSPFALAEEASDGLDPIVEKAQSASLRMMRGHAELVVRRTGRNVTASHAEIAWQLDAPAGGAATRFRGLGRKGREPAWISATLAPAEEAKARYAELPGAVSDYPAEAALLAWRCGTWLELKFFPVPPGEQRSVEYTFQIPTTFRDGRDH